MRKYDYDFQINERPLLVADAGVSITQQDIETEDSGKDELEVTHRSLARTGIYKIVYTYASVDREEYEYLRNLLLGKPYFTFSFLDLDGEVKQIKAYCNKLTASLHNARTGIYKKLKFTIQEC